MQEPAVVKEKRGRLNLKKAQTSTKRNPLAFEVVEEEVAKAGQMVTRGLKRKRKISDLQKERNRQNIAQYYDDEAAASGGSEDEKDEEEDEEDRKFINDGSISEHSTSENSLGLDRMEEDVVTRPRRRGRKSVIEDMDLDQEIPKVSPISFL